MRSFRTTGGVAAGAALLLLLSSCALTREATSAPGDGLDCPDESRTATIAEPAPDFAGHPTPEEAVVAMAQAAFVDGRAKHVGGDEWVIESSDGLAVARATVTPWQQGWFAGEITTCGGLEHGS